MVFEEGAVLYERNSPLYIVFLAIAAASHSFARIVPYEEMPHGCRRSLLFEIGPASRVAVMQAQDS